MGGLNVKVSSVEYFFFFFFFVLILFFSGELRVDHPSVFKLKSIAGYNYAQGSLPSPLVSFSSFFSYFLFFFVFFSFSRI